MNKRNFALLGCTIAVVLFFGINVLANASLRSMRFDLTEDRVFSLSDGSRALVSKLDDPIRLYYYYSRKVAAEDPTFQVYGNRVRELLEEFVNASDGKVILEVIDPEPFSEEEDRAVEQGLYGLPASGGTLYLGLVGTNAVDGREVIPFFDPRKERFLEYDVSKALYSLTHPERRVVGLVTTLPMEGSPPNPMLGQPGGQPWVVLEHLRTFFEVRDLGTELEEIPDDVDVLWVVHPKDLSDATLYAIDQFVLGGGEAVVYVDPHCESDRSGDDPTNPMASMGAPRGSNLGPLFRAWGIELVDGKVVGDRSNALRVTTGSQTNPESWDYVVWMSLGSDAFDKEDPITSLLEQVTLATAGAIRPLADASTELQPLVQTSEDSMLLDVGMVQFMPDPKRLLGSFVAEHERLTLAARVSGEVESAFPGGAPGGVGDELGGDEFGDDEPEDLDPDPLELTDAPEEGADEGGGDEVLAAETDGAPAGSGSGHLSASNGPIHVVVVADADLLTDRFWVREEKLFGQISLGYRKVSDNADLLVNAVENLSGGEELMSLRARGRFARPFERVEEIRRDAEQRFLAREQELQNRLSQIQSRINELQREKSPDSALILSPEQVEELERARDEKLATNKELREVQHGLRKDIERLGTQIKWLNISFVPFLVTAAAIGLGLHRVRRRTADSSR